MNENFPNREPVIVRDLELHIIRRLPANAEVKVRAGERISADHVIARTDPRNLAVRISLADQLGVLPQDTQKHLLRPVGSTFKAGEAIAKNRKGLRNTVVASPMNGTLMSIDPETGVGMLAPGSGGDIRALVAGDVEYVDGRQTVAIRSVGSRIFGVAGLGPSIEGVLTVPVAGPGDELQAAVATSILKLLQSNCERKVPVAGGCGLYQTTVLVLCKASEKGSGTNSQMARRVLRTIGS